MLVIEFTTYARHATNHSFFCLKFTLNYIITYSLLTQPFYKNSFSCTAKTLVLKILPEKISKKYMKSNTKGVKIFVF